MNKKIVVIADPDWDMLDTYQRFLSFAGFEVHTSTSGVDCRSQLDDLPADMLVLDIDLAWGGADGVLAHLRERDDAAAPRVVLTGSRRLDDSDLLGPPVVAWLYKPVNPRRLLETIRAERRPVLRLAGNMLR